MAFGYKSPADTGDILLELLRDAGQAKRPVQAQAFRLSPYLGVARFNHTRPIHKFSSTWSGLAYFILSFHLRPLSKFPPHRGSKVDLQPVKQPHTDKIASKRNVYNGEV
jgi:hypothetical protein